MTPFLFASWLLLAGAVTIWTGCADLVGCGKFCSEDFWKSADTAAVERQLKRGADILAAPESGYTRAPLRWAAQYGDREVIELVLVHSDGREDGRQLRAELMSEAVRYSAHDVLTLFFDRGVHIHAAESELLLHNALVSSNRPAVELLLEHGANISRRDAMGQTPLHTAAGSVEPGLVGWLLDRGANADLRSVSVQGDTPLHGAARSSEYQLEIIRLLLERGAGEDVDRANDNGLTPLHWAVGSPWAEPAAVELLLDRGANIHAVTKRGETALHIAARRAEPAVIEILLDRGADADLAAQSDPGDTPLHTAVEADDPEVITLLANRGADVSAQNDLGLTALHTAAKYGPPLEVVVALIAHGADVNALDNGGWTPLMHAACCAAWHPELLRTGGIEAQTARSAEMIELFLESGADPSARSYDGLTACEYAELAFDPFKGQVQPLVCP